EGAGAEAVQDQLLALKRLQRDDDAAADHAVEPVSLVAFVEDDLARRNRAQPQVLEQIGTLAVGQRPEQRMAAEHLLRSHAAAPLLRFQANISGLISLSISMIMSAGRLLRRAAMRIASMLGASYRQ